MQLNILILFSKIPILTGYFHVTNCSICLLFARERENFP